MGRAKNMARKMRLTRGKILVSLYQSTCIFMLFATGIFNKIADEEMEPNVVRMKVPELKNYLQVRGISDANKRWE